MADRKSISVQSGGNTVHLNKSNLGFSPADTHRNFQVCVEGLGAGTYTVSYMPVDCDCLIEFQDGAGAGEAVVLSQSIDILYDQLIISFAGLAVDADPKVHATFWPRGL